MAFFRPLGRYNGALSTSKKVRRLQDQIAVPMVGVGVMLGQQIVCVFIDA